MTSRPLAFGRALARTVACQRHALEAVQKVVTSQRAARVSCPGLPGHHGHDGHDVCPAPCYGTDYRRSILCNCVGLSDLSRRRRQAWEYEAVMIAARPTVEVVTAGTDWAAIVAAIVTGMAAIIGIAGTAWQASRSRQAAASDLRTSINAATANQRANIEAAAENLRASNDAEDRRALRAEKMRVYSEFQGAIDNLLVEGGVSNTRQAIAAVYGSAAAVTLIAPEDIGTLARYLAREAGKLADPVSVGVARQDTISGNREELYELMRADLGMDRH
jgi:hypothetical protein